MRTLLLLCLVPVLVFGHGSLVEHAGEPSPGKQVFSVDEALSFDKLDGQRHKRSHAPGIGGANPEPTNFEEILSFADNKKELDGQRHKRSHAPGLGGANPGKNNFDLHEFMREVPHAQAKTSH